MKNEYYLYERICALERIAADYAEGKLMCPEIRRAAEVISSQLYTVAVIGEFKRGKSSLINALIGSSVLPTDILPATATVTRLVYGTQPRVEVAYLDGRKEEQSIDQLERFATKLSSESRETARSIREVVVSFPSILCKNHIQLLDTPGLNDTEAMTELTMGVLDDVDAALVVLSALEPLSMTEQELIMELIAQPGIRHLIFVATYLDALRTEAEKDRIIAFVRRRIQIELLELAEERFSRDEALLKKARTILSEPDLFGVSSTQAVKGFVTDDVDLVDESRFPQFKEALLSILTAAQTQDLPAKTLDLAESFLRAMPGWKAEEDRLIKKEKEQLDELRRYRGASRRELLELFQNMDVVLKERGFDPSFGLDASQMEEKINRIFIKALGKLTTAENNTEAISTAILGAAEQAETEIQSEGESLRDAVETQMKKVEKEVAEQRKRVGIAPEAQQTEQISTPVPSFQIDRKDLLPSGNLVGLNVISTIREEVGAAVRRYNTAILKRIGAWRVKLMRQNDADVAAVSLAELDAQKSELDARASATDYNYSKQLRQVTEICEQLRGG